MATIINEMPDDVEDLDEGMDVDLEIKEPEAKVKKETKPTQDELDFEIEEEDDTPKADRGRDPLPKEVVEELEQDELTDYSERVKQRMAQLKKVWHDERREKEAADRERQEAIKYAQQIAEENKRLKSTLSSGEETYVKTLQGAYESELAIAKRDYREAYDAGDTDRIIEAQAKMNDAQMKLSQASNYQRKHDISLQQPENTVPLRQETNTPQVPKPDAKAQAWQAKNQWFGKDEEMTSLALGLHEKLVRSGIDPSSEDYYRRIDETMQRRFPENFIGDDDSLEQDKPSQRKPSTVVAPATRSTAPKKVRLTKTQLAFAKKLKLTPEQYAREMIKLERTNG
tara:strand:- start:2336 stop:3358 length:1023 start_codon:yes stop_codon:yes gene_type:complete